MKDKDFTIGAEDLGEIFGEELDLGGFIAEKKTQAPKKENSPPAVAAEKPAEKKAEAGRVEAPAQKQPAQDSLLIKRTKAEELEIAERAQKAEAQKRGVPSLPVAQSADNDVDDLIRRAAEIEKQLKTSKGAKQEAASLSFADFLSDSVVAEVIGAFEELRRAIASELASHINSKAINHMMLRTIEKSAVNFLVLRNANWSTDGKLREDGSIDPERVIQNVNKYKSQIQEIDVEMENGLKALFYLRVKSIKLGAGKEKLSALKEEIQKKMRIIDAGYRKGVIGFLSEKVVTPAFEKAEREE